MRLLKHYKRIKHKSNTPVQYQRGYTEFYKLKFNLTPDVLIPRPETELLVDEVIRFLTDHPERLRRNVGGVEGSCVILDLGTGCGNIAISIAKHLPTSDVGIRIIASDISKKALDVAKQNAKFHGVSDKIIFIKSDLLHYDTLVYHSNLPDIIVTNLPYIPTQRIPYLDSSVKDFEPLIALDGGSDGFELYRKLFAQIKEKKWKPKLIVCEIDYTHRDIALNEAQKLVVSEVEPYFPKAQIEIKTDLAHKQRILIIK